MDFKGRLSRVSKDLTTDEFVIEIRTKDNILKAYEKLKEKVVSVKVAIFRKKRSLTANGYYWKLLGMVADTLGHSQAYMHNEMLRRHPRIEMIEDRPVIVMLPDTIEAEKKIDESEELHLLPTDVTERGNRQYMLLRGSKTYDTKEMSILIDDIVQEAKEQGIETLPPAEIERMKKEWGIEIEQTI